MAPTLDNAFPWHLHVRRAGMSLRVGMREHCRSLTVGLMALVLVAWADTSRAVLLWSDLGTAQLHETGPGTGIVGGGLRREDSATDKVYFKYHVDPLSDPSTEIYFAAFQLFEGNHERMAVGKALNA